jgi:hypothetical protein
VPFAAPAPFNLDGHGEGTVDALAAAAAMASDEYPHMKQSGVVPRIQNVVAMFNLGTKLNLKHIGLHAKNAEVKKEKTPKELEEFFFIFLFFFSTTRSVLLQ